jgi:hypothetical protein
MPYIKQKDREELIVQGRAPQTAGELNFFISTLIENFIDTNGMSYERINQTIGVLECAKLELYRRVAVPYENTKIDENGDVYEGLQE